MTKAQEISGKLNNDGTCWETQDGTTFAELVAGANATEIIKPGLHIIRHVFGDGSTIVEAGNGEWWDTEE